MTAPVALVRPPGEELARAARTHIAIVPIDAGRAREQHAAYVDTLRELGVRVVLLPHAPEHPDAVFVEDTVIAVPELAVLTRPGALSRRAETAGVAPVLHGLVGRTAAVRAPATLDGGDVLRVGRRLFVGVSTRTNEAAGPALRELLEPYGYQVDPVPVRGHLHLKTAVTALPDGSLLTAPGWDPPAPLVGLPRRVAPEVSGANVLVVGDTVLVAASAPRTAELVARLGHPVRLVEIGELEKAEAGLTCLSVLLTSPIS